MLVALIALLWYFSGSKQDTTKSTFGKSNLTVNKSSDSKKESEVDSSNESSTSSSTKTEKKKDNQVVKVTLTKTN